MDISLKTVEVVVYKQILIIDGEEFDYMELIELLSDMECSSVRIFEPVASKLQKLGIIDSPGGSFAATKGPNYGKFYKELLALET